MQAIGLAKLDGADNFVDAAGKIAVERPGVQPRARDKARSVQSLASVSTMSLSVVSIIDSTVRGGCEDLTMTAMIIREMLKKH